MQTECTRILFSCVHFLFYFCFSLLHVTRLQPILFAWLFLYNDIAFLFNFYVTYVLFLLLVHF